ncbi:DUF2179 domain-containing protein [Exiguobacterium sp. AM39-5BH]|uniref:DUF2179 domain-containing protein n=1 Tax=Exiguobacterium sp. AM39-5BH TaxID=2292355 RepID=UPI000FE1B914|nr:DUF2179 domain-containing protein [Exiguobacterium sp. AM39-5BH]RHB46698.1 DUF2179 domain-containing protein [Exiguobacterium sp. AM39-5BH]
MGQILLILVLQLVYVPVLTLRTIMLVKGKTMIAGLFGTLETLIYIFALGIVFQDLTTIGMVVYAVGFGLGILVGGYVERKLAIGYNMIQVHTQEFPAELIQKMRDSGYGVTHYQGQGRDGIRYRLDVLAARTRMKDLREMVEAHEPKAFLVAFDPIDFKGGYMMKGLRRPK